jgi:hypothetical protein
MFGKPPKPAYAGGSGKKNQAGSWKRWETPPEYTTQPRGGKRGLRKAKGVAARNELPDEEQATPVDRSNEINMAKLLAQCRVALKDNKANPEIALLSEKIAEKIEEVTSAERQAARAAKPWKIRLQHVEKKRDHKQRTTDSAKNKLTSSEEELVLLKARVVKERGEYHDRKSELDKCFVDVSVCINEKPIDASSDEDDDSDEDDAYTKQDMRGTIARLESEAREAAVLLARFRDDRTARAGGQNPASSCISICSGDGGHENEEPPRPKRPVLGKTATGTKLARTRRSRSRGSRIQLDDDSDAIMDADGAGKVYPA